MAASAATSSRMAFFEVMSEAEVSEISVPASASSRELRATYSKFGCVLVTEVLDAGACAQLEQLWAADLEHAAGEVPVPARRGVFGNGYAAHRGLPQGRFAWAARLHARDVFAKLFECDAAALAVGMDQIFWQECAEPATENEQWLHVDTNSNCAGCQHVTQGVLYVRDARGAAASTTALWPQSHLEVFDRLMRDPHSRNLGKKPEAVQSVKLNHMKDRLQQRELLSQALAGTRRVPCPPGSLLLWDSRLVHQGWAGGLRLAQPVCWEPRVRQDGAARGRKLLACAAGCSTTHSSSEAKITFARHAPELVRPPRCIVTGRWGGAQQLWSQLYPSVRSLIQSGAQSIPHELQSQLEGMLRKEVREAL